MLKSLVQSTRRFVANLVGWLIIAPIVTALPRRKDWLAVIGRDEGKFVDNAKYFFLEAALLLRPTTRVVFITERPDVANMLANTSYEVLIFPTWRAIWFFLRAGTTVVDSADWALRFRRFLLMGSKTLQLWHGVGYKRIELDQWKNEVGRRRWLSSPLIFRLRTAKQFLTCRLVRYDAVNATSSFYLNHVFLSAFLSRHFIIAGYPRNTFGRIDTIKDYAWLNVDNAIRRLASQWISQGRQLILVAPTYRDSRATVAWTNNGVVKALDDWCAINRLELIFKFHPLERQSTSIQGNHLHLCDSNSDIYPLMPLSSALVTDYSSIYMDYLTLDKPIFFLMSDADEYIRKDREFQFDFKYLTPGPIFKSVSELMENLGPHMKNDLYGKARAKTKQLAFDNIPQESSVQRLIEFMRAQNWISVHSGGERPD